MKFERTLSDIIQTQITYIWALENEDGVVKMIIPMEDQIKN